MALRRRSTLICALLSGCLVLVLWLSGPDPAETAIQEEKPRLVVLVVFDQLRGDYLIKWQDLFDKDGFGRLHKDGAWYQNCHYPYANTYTAAGHASMVTGCSPDKHGIIGNDWYDRKLGENVSAVRSDRFALVPERDGKEGASPELLRQPTVGDALMAQTKGKVVSISLKDRAAILMAALRGALAFWFADGMWVSSTHYRDALPNWVSRFNKVHAADQWFGKDWNRLRPDLDYVKFSGVDDFPFEGNGYRQGRTFPHPTTGGLTKPGRAYYGAMTTSPFGNDMILQLAKIAIEEEKLGQGGQPDLLCLGFTSNDYVGHCWGPDSQEVLDITLRSDLILKDLMGFLDQKVGRGKYLLVVCADHGVCPLPEWTKAQGKDAGRISVTQLISRAQKFLNTKFGGGKERPYIEAASLGMFYLKKDVIQEQGLKQADVEKALAGWLVQQDGIQAAYTRTQLSAGPIQGDHIGALVQKSFDAERSGDVLMVLKPHWLGVPAPRANTKYVTYTTTHGSPHPYDTHVPLLVYGPGVRPGIRKELVQPQAIAAILSRGLGIRPPAGAAVGVPIGLMK